MSQTTLRSFFVAICIATLAAEVAAELKASRPETDAAPIPAPATAESPANSPLVVRLQRIDGGNNSHFYVGRLSVGLPAQEFQVLFDTASGHVLLPHQSCSSPACKKHRQYNPWKTESAMDVNADGKAVQEGVRLVKGKTPRDAISVEFAQADLGDGAAQAVLVRDDVCVGTEFSGQVCTKVDMMAAIKLDDELFDMMPYDGMLGLGLAGLSSESGCTYFSRLMESHPGLLPQFGLSLGAQSGEIYFGGHDSSRMASPLEWFPVLHPDDGFWEVTVKAVRLGNVTVDACEDGCRGIVDTGASRLGVQEDNFDGVHAALARAAPMVGGGCQGADLEFDLGSLSLKLRVEDYAAGAACEPQLGPLDLDSKEYKGVYAFGETVLRRYYTAFDWQGRRIGFAPVASRRVRLGGSRAASSEREFTV